MDEKLIEFLQRVPSARWRNVPKGWSEQFRTALSDRLVKVGWGGIIELTASALDALPHLSSRSENDDNHQAKQWISTRNRQWKRRPPKHS